MNTAAPVKNGPAFQDAERLGAETATAGRAKHRDAQGRFIGGNPGGPGNPFARQVAHLRQVLLSCVTDEEMRIIGGELVLQAKMGNLVAMKLLFQYMLGKPTAGVDPDTLDQQEMGQYQQGLTPEQLQELMLGRRQQPGELIELIRILLPVFAEQFKQAVGETLRNNPPAEQADGDEEEDESIEAALAEEDEETELEAAPSPNGGLDAKAGQTATRTPSANGDARTTAARETATRTPSPNGGLDAKGRQTATRAPSPNGDARATAARETGTRTPSPNGGNGRENVPVGAVENGVKERLAAQQPGDSSSRRRPGS